MPCVLKTRTWAKGGGGRARRESKVPPTSGNYTKSVRRPQQAEDREERDLVASVNFSWSIHGHEDSSKWPLG